MQGLFRTRDTSVRWQDAVDIVAKLLWEVAFGNLPKRNTKVDYLIDLLQFLNVRLKSRSLDVWDCLKNASHPIFTAEFFRVSPQQIRGFVLPLTLRVVELKLLTVNFRPSSTSISRRCWPQATRANEYALVDQRQSQRLLLSKQHTHTRY